MKLTFTDKLCRASLSLSLDNDGLLLLNGAVDNKGSTLGLLLGNLLGLDGLGELGREGHVDDRDIVEDNVEAGSALDQVLADQAGDTVTLGDELRGIELGDDGL